MTARISRRSDFSQALGSRPKIVKSVAKRFAQSGMPIFPYRPLVSRATIIAFFVSTLQGCGFCGGFLYVTNLIRSSFASNEAKYSSICGACDNTQCVGYLILSPSAFPSSKRTHRITPSLGYSYSDRSAQNLVSNALLRRRPLRLLLRIRLGFYGFRMPCQRPCKLLAILVVALAIAGAVIWQQFASRPVSSTTIMITSTVTTVTGSQTIVTPQRQME